MNHPHQFTIDLNERFPRLDHPPIVEAVIHWRARSQKELVRDELQKYLIETLPEYPVVRPQHEIQFDMQLRSEETSQEQRANFHGFRLESADGRDIAQFTRNGFVFSRLSPYEDWMHFAEEAKKLWRIHQKFSNPSEVNRLGVRFINRLTQINKDNLGEILKSPPQYPNKLVFPISEYLNRTQYDVPCYPYKINITQMIQPPMPSEAGAFSLILDLDVFTTTPNESDDAILDKRLQEMRWLKNKAFFSLLTEQTIERLKETSA